ncbi:MAG: response regulator [Rhodospirillaceae bacterium]|nr:response regulator [Rhodospirillaceae bacterium]
MARVLIVDDDRFMRQSMRRGLEGCGHEVEEAGDGCEALLVQRHAPAETVVVDVVMPVMGGLELMARLRREYPDLRIIAVTEACGACAGELLSMAERLGADASFTKPVPPNDLARLAAAPAS